MTPNSKDIKPTAWTQCSYVWHNGTVFKKVRHYVNHRPTRQFRIKDVIFFKYNSAGKLQPLPNNATDEEIMSADAATLQISNQKNGHAGVCIHHTAIAGNMWVCPVKALARSITHSRQHTKNKKAFICTYFDEAGMGSVTDTQIRFTVKFAAKSLHYDERDIPNNMCFPSAMRRWAQCREGWALSLLLLSPAPLRLTRYGVVCVKEWIIYVMETLYHLKGGLFCKATILILE